MENEYMKGLIADFEQHLEKALEIGKTANFNSAKQEIRNVVVCGLGGSGIGGTLVQKILENELSVPFVTNKDYHLPSFINQNTLVICSSYSGNTEETLMMYEEASAKEAEVAVITSGGKFKEIAAEKQLNHIIIPGGLPPRAAFGLSFPQLFFVLHQHALIGESFIGHFESAINLLKEKEAQTKELAKEIAKELNGKIPVLYAESRWEGMLVRMRQQLNENSKMLAWHSVFPELNHNELVGWKKENQDLMVLLYRDEDDYYRNQARFEFSKKEIKNRTPHFREIYCEGNSFIEKHLYFIHLNDWVSYYLAEEQNLCSVEIKVINGLKNMLAELD